MLELGWSKERLATAAPDVVEAARWRLYVDAIWPIDIVAEVFQPDPLKDPGAQEAKRLHAKAQAQRHYNDVRKVIYPPDEGAG